MAKQSPAMCNGCSRPLAPGDKECRSCGLARGSKLETYRLAGEEPPLSTEDQSGSETPPTDADLSAGKRKPATTLVNLVLKAKEGEYTFPHVCCYCLGKANLTTRKIEDGKALFHPVQGKSATARYHGYWGYVRGEQRGTQVCRCLVPICRSCLPALKRSKKAEAREDAINSLLIIPPVAGGFFFTLMFGVHNSVPLLIVSICIALAWVPVYWFGWGRSRMQKLKAQAIRHVPEIMLSLVAQVGEAEMMRNREAWYKPYDVYLTLPKRYARLFMQQNRQYVKDACKIDDEWV